MNQTQDLLAKLREAKEAKGLSYQDIVDITEQNGEAVSFTTVRRVLSKGAKLADFRYGQTICPIVRAVLGKEEEEPALQQKPVDSVSAIIALKDERIAEYKEEIQRLKKSEKFYRIAFVITICVLVALFAVDFSLGNFGWIRY